MGYQSLFFRPARGFRKYEETRVGIGGQGGRSETTLVPSDILYQLDGVITEQHQSMARVTKHPVEYGVDLSDHVIKQPQKIVINGIVTNSPFIKQLANTLPGDPKFGTQFVEVLKGERVRNAYAGLVEIQNERLPLQLQTGLLTYDNMILTGISAPSDLQNNLKVRLTFEEVFIADGRRTGAIQAVTTTPTAIDVATVATTLAGLGLTFAGGAAFAFGG